MTSGSLTVVTLGAGTVVEDFSEVSVHPISFGMDREKLLPPKNRIAPAPLQTDPTSSPAEFDMNVEFSILVNPWSL